MTVMANDFFEGMQKSQFHFVYTPCTNGTWAMYEWYMSNVRNRNDLFTPSNYASHNHKYTSYAP